MRKAFLIPIISCVIIALATLFLYAQNKTKPMDVKDALYATCKVINNESGIRGTGVVLKTGYIITAAHCVDANINDVVEDDEKDITVEFFDNGTWSQDADIMFCGKFDTYDIAILRVPNPPESDVVLADAVAFGDRVYAIGCTNGYNPNISEGRVSTDADGLARAGLSVWQGNSGGGLWTNSQKLAGIVVRVGMATTYSFVDILIPSEEGAYFSRNHIQVHHPLANWCAYVPTETIKYQLDKKGLTFLYEVQEEEFSINKYYILMLLEIAGVLAGVWFFRKHVLC